MPLQLPAPNFDDENEYGPNHFSSSAGPWDQDEERPDDHPQQHRRARQRNIPSAEEILVQLVQLNGAVVTGIINTAKAIVIQRGLKMMLEVQFKKQDNKSSSASPEAMAELCRQDPKMLEIIEPFLTQEQINWILQHPGE